MAIKVTGTTVIDDSRNIVNVNNLSSSGVSTIGNFKISAGIITSTSGVVTYYGDGSKLSNINTGVSSLTIGRRTSAAIISVGSGRTDLLTRSGIVTLIIA